MVVKSAIPEKAAVLCLYRLLRHGTGGDRKRLGTYDAGILRPEVNIPKDREEERELLFVTPAHGMVKVSQVFQVFISGLHKVALGALEHAHVGTGLGIPNDGSPVGQAGDSTIADR